MQETRPAAVEFLLYQPNMPPVRHALREGVVTLGRASECTIPIRDRFLSRKHAEISWNNGSWVLRDCGSANGTFVNGVRVFADMPLHPGDRITLGDAELVFRDDDAITDNSFSVEDSLLATNMAMAVRDVVEEDLRSDHAAERLQILNALAIELLEDRPMNDLFDFILDRVMNLVHPTRAAIALLADDKKSFLNVKVKRREAGDAAELAISRTLLSEVVEEKKVISFFDLKDDDKLAQAKSIIGQSIRSAICAPLITQDVVIGVLYADFLVSQKRVPEEDLRLMAQIARFAAVKVETTRLREEAVVKQRIEEELKMTYVIQSRLLPAVPPVVEGYSFAGVSKPCRTVSGDYFDYVVKPDGRIYFVVADVAGKGITAALVMAGLATAFSIFTEDDPTPAELLGRLNRTLQPKLSPSKFATVFTGILEPSTGAISFANAGHTPPLCIRKDSILALNSTDLVVGLIAGAKYRDQSVNLAHGDSIVLFTDGIIEAENAAGEELGSDATSDLLKGMHGTAAVPLVKHMEQAVLKHVGGCPLGDDVTIVAVTRH